MARRSRQDAAGVWHHVMNRAIARRSMFETKADIRYFLACIARAVRRNQIEVHAWCVLTTHFHMLIRSPRGELSAGLRRIQNQYVRYFNRTRQRDGTLVRGRFRSKPVDSLRYRQILVRYIDANPVGAGLCTDSRDYPWCSARQYSQCSGPPWLTRTWVEAWMMGQYRADHYHPAQYPYPLEEGARRRVASLVESRLNSANARDDFDSLVGQTSSRLLTWLRRKAALADGTHPGLAHADAATVTETVTAFAAKQGAFGISTSRETLDAWRILHAGLLRDLACEGFSSIALRVERSASSAQRFGKVHRELLRENPSYGRVAAVATQEILSVNLDLDWRVRGAE